MLRKVIKNGNEMIRRLVAAVRGEKTDDRVCTGEDIQRKKRVSEEN